MSKRILIVDDLRNARIAYSELIKTHIPEAELLTADSGRSALETAIREIPDLILLDVKLGDMSGLDVCRSLKLHEATSDVPIMMVSAVKVSSQDRVAGLDCGADGYLCKPFEVDECVAEVKSLMRVHERDSTHREHERRLESRLATIFDNVNDIIVHLDTKGRILDVNDRVSEFLGYEPHEIIGRHFTATGILLKRDIPSLAARYVAALVSDKPPETAEVEVRHKQGHTVHVEANTKLVRSGGKVVGVVSVVRDITYRKMSETALRQSREQLRALVWRLESIREDEQKRISRDIHDVVGHALMALKLEVATLENKFAQRTAGGQCEAFLKQTRAMHAHLNEVAAATRQIVSDLRPGLLDDVGIGAAIEWQVEEYSRLTGIHVEADIDFNIRMDGPRSTMMYRVCQELLRNVVQHAGPSRVEVDFRRRDDRIVLRVTDDGCGFDVCSGNATSGLGLLGIRERVNQVGGEVRMKSEVGRGTEVFVTVSEDDRPRDHDPPDGITPTEDVQE